MKRLLNAIFRPYTVAVVWEGDRFVHRARTEHQAFEWARQYGRGTTVAIGRRGRVVAHRVTA